MDEFVQVEHPDAGKARMSRTSFESVFKAKGWREVGTAQVADPELSPAPPEPTEPTEPPARPRKRTSNGGK